MSMDKSRADALAEFKRLREGFTASTTQKSFSALVLGGSGTGKSFLTRTARAPVHIDAFDPGTARGLRDEILAGRLVVDSSFEVDDPFKPTAFSRWEKLMDKRIASGYFNHVATYVLDSATTWASAIMAEILKQAGIPGQTPRFTHDYGPQKKTIDNWLRKILTLPCDFILTGHLEQVKDELSGKVSWRFFTTGKGSLTIPLLFDEIWVTDPKETSKGTEYRLLTQATGSHIARSRLAQDGKLDKWEAPNIRAILKKTGYNHEDLPLV